MDQGLKERLVGAAVLVAIAVWLIPWVLDGPEGPLETNGSALQLPAAEEPMPMRTQTLRLGDAAEPSAEPTTAAVQPLVAEPRRPSRRRPPKAPPQRRARQSEAPAVAAVRPEPERARPCGLAACDCPEAAAETGAGAAATGDWTVQLGSFSEEANARRLAQRVGTFGYKAEVASLKK